MKIKLDEGARVPSRAHSQDAGLDLFAIRSGWVRAKNSNTFHTGVHVELPEGTTGILLPKSGLMCKNNIISALSVIVKCRTNDNICTLNSTNNTVFATVFA